MLSCGAYPRGEALFQALPAGGIASGGQPRAYKRGGETGMAAVLRRKSVCAMRTQ